MCCSSSHSCIQHEATDISHSSVRIAGRSSLILYNLCCDIMFKCINICLKLQMSSELTQHSHHFLVRKIWIVSDNCRRLSVSKSRCHSLRTTKCLLYWPLGNVAAQISNSGGACAHAVSCSQVLKIWLLGCATFLEVVQSKNLSPCSCAQPWTECRCTLHERFHPLGVCRFCVSRERAMLMTIKGY